MSVAAAGSEAPVLEVVELVKDFPAAGDGARAVRAVDGVSLSLGRREVLGLVGESGCGKSTLARCILRLLDPTAGQVWLNGNEITHLSRREMRPHRRELQIVFQDPHSSLNPRLTCGTTVADPLRRQGLAGRGESAARVEAMFDAVGLHSDLRHRYPHELSGGQRQRVALARALVARPTVLVADEPVSALDVSVQAGILNLLGDLQHELGFSCLFISHDLATVEYLCDRVAVMSAGRIVETGTRLDVFGAPRHPATQALLAAALVPDPALARARAG